MNKTELRANRLNPKEVKTVKQAYAKIAIESKENCRDGKGTRR